MVNAKRGMPDAKYMLSNEDEAKIVGGASSIGITGFDYIEAGIKLFSQDNGPTEYFYSGRQISKACANTIVDFYITYGRRPAQSEVQLN